jgi:hypothetical protein
VSKAGKDRPPAGRGVGADDFTELSLEDTLSQKARGLWRASKTGRSGYNPYDTGPTEKAPRSAQAKKPTDLRKLSEWIRLTREVEALKHSRNTEKED